MKLYLCGPVTLGGSCTPAQERDNLELFHDAEKQLIAAGYAVESPAKILGFCVASLAHLKLPGDGEPPSLSGSRWQWYMRRTLIQMLTCDAIATLDRVEQSRGCITELKIGSDLGLPAKSYRTWLELAAQVHSVQR